MDLNSLAQSLRSSTSLSKENANLSVFSEEPVSLDTFIQDTKFLKNPPLSPIQYEAVRHIERIYYPDIYPLIAQELGHKKNRTIIFSSKILTVQDIEQNYWATPLRMVNNVVLQWGKGGGKDHVARICSMRIAYLLLCLVSPQEYFKMPEQDTIHMLNVASSSTQAQQAFFNPITRAVKRGWFEGKCEPHVNTISYDKNVESISGHSDAETQEGNNLILGVADEIDAFRSRAELQATQRSKSARDPSRSAESILDLLNSSAKTRFPETYKVVKISYPRFLGSMIQTLTAEAKKDVKEKGEKSRYYFSGPYATWEVRPNITKEHFQDDYDKDPVLARAKYECKPARSVSPYFRNNIIVESCMKHSAVPEVGVEYRRDGDTWVPVYSFSPHLKPIQGARYAMHGDLAVKGDRAGVAMAHVVRYQEYETGVTSEDGSAYTFMESRPFVKVDFVIPFTADISVEPSREIQIRWARQLAFELVKKGFNIRQFTFDGFESLDSIQILNAHGIPAKRVSTDLSETPWRTLRDLMNEGRVEIPFSTLLLDEILGLTRMPNRRIDHLLGGSKDTADAVACSVLGAVELGGSESENAEVAEYGPSTIEVGPMTETPYGLSGMQGLPMGYERFLPSSTDYLK